MGCAKRKCVVGICKYVWAVNLQISYEVGQSDNGLCYTIYMDVSYSIQDTKSGQQVL